MNRRSGLFLAVFAALLLAAAPGQAEGWWPWNRGKGQVPEATRPAPGVLNFGKAGVPKPAAPAMIKTAYGDLDPAYLRIDGKRPVMPEDLRKVSLVLRMPALQAAMTLRQARDAALKAGVRPPVPAAQAAETAKPAPAKQGGAIYLKPGQPKAPPKVFTDF